MYQSFLDTLDLMNTRDLVSSNFLCLYVLSLHITSKARGITSQQGYKAKSSKCLQPFAAQFQNTATITLILRRVYPNYRIKEEEESSITDPGLCIQPARPRYAENLRNVPHRLR